MPEMDGYEVARRLRGMPDLQHTLLAAYLRAGRADEARALLARRVDRQPSVPVAGA